MKSLIPVICDTPFCNTVWLSGNFDIGQGATIVFRNSRTNACPKCGGFGHIADGEYTATSATLFDIAQRSLVIQALYSIQQRVAAGASAKELSREIDESAPFLSGLKRYLPANSSDLSNLLIAVFTLLALLLSYVDIEGDEPMPPVLAPKEHVQDLEKAAGALKSNPASNPPEARPEPPKLHRT